MPIMKNCMLILLTAMLLCPYLHAEEETNLRGVIRAPFETEEELRIIRELESKWEQSRKSKEASQQVSSKPIKITEEEILEIENRKIWEVEAVVEKAIEFGERVRLSKLSRIEFLEEMGFKEPIQANHEEVSKPRPPRLKSKTEQEYTLSFHRELKLNPKIAIKETKPTLKLESVDYLSYETSEHKSELGVERKTGPPSLFSLKIMKESAVSGWWLVVSAKFVIEKIEIEKISSKWIVLSGKSYLDKTPAILNSPHTRIYLC
jgi:hypothetical protein